MSPQKKTSSSLESGAPLPIPKKKCLGPLYRAVFSSCFPSNHFFLATCKDRRRLLIFPAGKNKKQVADFPGAPRLTKKRGRQITSVTPYIQQYNVGVGIHVNKWARSFQLPLGNLRQKNTRSHRDMRKTHRETEDADGRDSHIFFFEPPPPMVAR